MGPSFNDKCALAQTIASMEACMLCIKLTNKINVTHDLLNESLVFATYHDITHSGIYTLKLIN